MARRATLPRRAWKSMRRHPVATTATVAVLVVGLLVGFGWQAFRQARVPRLVSEAQLMMVQGEYRKGIELAEAALALDPDNPDARLVRARSLFQGRRFVEAVEEARAVLRADPDNWVAHMLIVAAARNAVPSVDASRHLAAVEGLVPDTADAFYLRGTLADSNREAIEWLDRTLELDPGHLEAAALEREDHLRAARPGRSPGVDLRRQEALGPARAPSLRDVGNQRCQIHRLGGELEREGKLGQGLLPGESGIVLMGINHPGGIFSPAVHGIDLQVFHLFSD